jgi:hypothetical protein
MFQLAGSILWLGEKKCTFLGKLSGKELLGIPRWRWKCTIKMYLWGDCEYEQWVGVACAPVQQWVLTFMMVSLLILLPKVSSFLISWLIIH